MKRIFGVFFVLGLTISTLAYNLPTKAQSNQNNGNTGKSSNIAATDTRVFSNPREGDNIPVDVVVKGASGLSEKARQQGANAFCKANQYTQAINFTFDRDSTVGTMQWNQKSEQWEFCEECTMYLTKVTCK
ncbi:hypothetical protein IQ270_05470 [Microcoleus sp. LEGE 07076]|uniref:hypothetical protein n=1 Tax=Microcoleus sp. LEGE 07076 TaxID=915322 RepID=UPI001882EA8E|nr:hypothetical protein [Microcoleus sp. LEGE 07076]MBE9184184.1 hypothetical protein [Microcoleus sp. LEGE 07076]